MSRADEVPDLNDLGKVDPRACTVCGKLGAHKHEFSTNSWGAHKRPEKTIQNISHEMGPTGLVEARGAGPFAGMRARWRGPGDPETLFSEGCDDNFARAVQKYRVLWGV